MADGACVHPAGGQRVNPRTVAEGLARAGYRVTFDLMTDEHGAARVICRAPKTLRNWRYNAVGPRWRKDESGGVWYSVEDLVEWRTLRASPKIGTNRDINVLGDGRE